LQYNTLNATQIQVIKIFSEAVRVIRSNPWHKIKLSIWSTKFTGSSYLCGECWSNTIWHL